MSENTDAEYWTQVESIMDRIRPGINEDGVKWVGDRLNNAWHEGITIDDWINNAGIKDYLN